MLKRFSKNLSVKFWLAAGSASLALAGGSVLPDMAVAQQGAGKQMQGGASGGAAGAGHGQGQGGQAGREGSGAGLGGIFKEITGMDDPVDGADAAPDAVQGRPADAGQSGSAAAGGKGGAGGGKPATAGAKKGDLFGDLWIILRDENGVPLLTEEGFVQPIDAEGNLIALDEEGKPVDETLTVEVELGRLNVGRAPNKVLDARADEVIAVLSSATALTTDAAGRLVLTIDGEAKTIDAPLENLAIYISLLTTGSIPGLTPDDLVGTEYDFLVDGLYTPEDLAASAAFLAAATDKTGVFTSDEIAYINSFVGINLATVGDVTYSDVDYSSFSYDRSDSYADVMATVLVDQDDGTFAVEEVNIYDVVFGSVDLTASGSLDAYTQAADDARAVIEFIHEYAVPETME